jgi:hypothetical protein
MPLISSVYAVIYALQYKTDINPVQEKHHDVSAAF